MGHASCSVEHAALVRGNHVLDVNEGVIATVHLEHFERLLNQIAEVLLLALRVVDAVTNVQVLLLEEVHDRQDLTVVRHKSLTDGITAGDKGLEDVQGSGDDVGITGVQGRFTNEHDKKVKIQVLQIFDLLLIGIMS